MFSIQPFEAEAHDFDNDDGKLTDIWHPCRVIGIDASSEEPTYIVETRSARGEFSLARADIIRKLPPTAMN